MVSSVSSNAAFSSAALSGSQCRGTRDPQAFQEKLFSKLDVNGDGSIDPSELSQFVDSASSSTKSAGTDLFQSMDTDGDGKLSKTELADGTKKLFEDLRTQLMSASSSTATNATQDAPPASGHHQHHGGGGMFGKIAQLLDQYRSTATNDSSATTAEASTATLSVAA